MSYKKPKTSLEIVLKAQSINEDEFNIRMAMAQAEKAGNKSLAWEMAYRLGEKS